MSFSMKVESPVFKKFLLACLLISPKSIAGALALLPWLCLAEETHRVLFLVNLCKAAQTAVESLSLPHLLAPADLHEVWRPWWKIIACLISSEFSEARLPRKQIRCVVIAYSEMFGIAEAGLPKGWDFCS